MSSAAKPSSNDNTLPWVEKYRPVVLKDVVGNQETVDRLNVIAMCGNMPNLILAGAPGIGKTTSILCLAHALLGPTFKEAVLELNASDDRGIDVVRNRIKMFAQKKVNLPAGRHKIIILDEADSMTPGAQQALRRTMEIYSNTTRFALACNLSGKIIEPIQSRCAILRYGKLHNEQVLHRLVEICRAEDVKYTPEGLEAIAFSADGDMRQAVNNLQSTTSGFGLITPDNVFRVCDQPHPVIIRKMLESCGRGEVDDAVACITVLWTQGYSAVDIITSVFRVVKVYDDLDEDKKLKFIREIGITHMRIVDGLQTLVQLQGLAARLCKFALPDTAAALLAGSSLCGLLEPSQQSKVSSAQQTSSDLLQWRTGSLTPEQRNIFIRVVHNITSMLGAAVFWVVVAMGILVVNIVLPVIGHLGYALLYAATPVRAAVMLTLLSGVFGLYYFRYYYAAPKKPTAGGKGKLKSADRDDTAFDLHPDVTHNEDSDGTSYMASLEARGTGRQGHRLVGGGSGGRGSAGIGFPADFLNMFMKSISIFGYIEEPVFHEFSRQLQTRRLLAGERMFDTEEDRDDQSFYVVIDGQVQIFLADDSAVATPEPIPQPSVSPTPASEMGGSLFSALGGGMWSEDEDNLSAIDDTESSAAILLNVVGPGDVLSSLFSILSLFTAGVPVRRDPRNQHTVPTSAAQHTDQDQQQQQQRQSLADYTLSEAQSHVEYHGVEAAGARASPLTCPNTLPPTASNHERRSSIGSHIFLDTAISNHAPSSVFTSARSDAATTLGASKALRPNIVARATVDTTLAMIPASAFQRVTKLYPKAAAHILQVILTRLQRVTFNTLYDYLDLPNELVSIERAISGLARYPLNDKLASSDVLQHIKDICAKHAVEADPTPSLPLNRASSKHGLPSRYLIHLGAPSGSLQSSWKISQQSLQLLARSSKQKQLPRPPHRGQEAVLLADDLDGEMGPEFSPSIPAARLGSGQRHRRAGSDNIPLDGLPSSEDIDSLRRDVLDQLCLSLGLNPHALDGRHSHSHAEGSQRHSNRSSSPLGTPIQSSSTSVSRRSSAHRKPLRTEHLLPLLQSLKMPDHQHKPMGHTPLLPLAEIPSLVNELDLYQLPDDFVLVEQGQRPEGLYIILDGQVEIMHRDSITEFAGGEARMKKPGDAAISEQLAGRASISEMCRQMTELARRDLSLSPRLRPASIAREPHSYGDSRKSVAKMRSTNSLYEGIDEPEDNSGSRHTDRRRADGSRAPRPYHARAGDVVGYLPALTDMSSLYTARSKGGVLVGFVSRWALDRISERYPIILMTLARRLTSQLPPAILNIDYALEWVQVKASQMVYRQGEMSDAVYVVLTGRLRAFVEKDNGAISILAEFGQGQSVGEPNLLLSDACKFNLHAIRDTELVRIPTALFKALMHSAPRLTFHLSRTLAVRATQSLQRQLIAEQQLGSGAGLETSLESGIRTHNGNLKSIAIIPVNADVPVRAFAEQLEETLAGIAGSVALLDHTAVSRVLGRHAFSRIARLKIVSWIAELEQRCRLLLHVADGGISSPWTRHCVRHSDFVLLVGLGDGDPGVGEFERLLLALKTTARKELVLLHENRSSTTGTTREWLKRRPWVHAHHHIQMALGLEEYGLAAEGSNDDGSVGGGSRGGNRRNTGSVLERARSLIFKSILQPSGRVLANGGIGIIRTSLQKYYRRLTRDRKLTPVTYQGHRSDFARLGRYLCGKSIGVVLSGGGARGIALLGVLQAFEEAGIPVDMIGGTSIGAFMSGLYAQNPDSVAIHGPVKAFSRRMSSMWRFLLDVTYPILAYTSGREFNRAIWKVFKEAEIEDLWLPFYCMTANITQSRPVVHTRGLLWRVVRASMSLGGFVPPLCDENGDLLVDGGYLDNLPVRIMKNELGANMIFAIDIAGENDTSPVRYGESVSGFWVLLNHLNPLRSYWIPTLSEVQSRLTYASSDKELESAKIADSCVYLRVPPRDVGVLDFGRFDELYRRGYEYSKAWTARWQQAGLLEPWQTSAGNPVVAAAAAAAAARGSSAEGSTRPACGLARRNSI
ncbi:phosphatidylcholine and lysophosphatidylcholine phospholipase [Coemansia sp. RSA 2050]|nr:phosphatidylcholine and lysophosphatidylcholine phospholipase [Coemansia sp. RSA 2050]